MNDSPQFIGIQPIWPRVGFATSFTCFMRMLIWKVKYQPQQ